MNSGSAGYALADNEREIVRTSTGERWPIQGRARDVYRALSYARGRVLGRPDLLAIVWGGVGAGNNATMAVRTLRRAIAPDVVESVGVPWGYIIR